MNDRKFHSREIVALKIQQQETAVKIVSVQRSPHKQTRNFFTGPRLYSIQGSSLSHSATKFLKKKKKKLFLKKRLLNHDNYDHLCKSIYDQKKKKKFDEIRKILSRLIRRYEDIRIRKLKKERKKIKKETRSEIKKIRRST